MEDDDLNHFLESRTAALSNHLIVDNIFQHLYVKDLVNCRAVNHSFHQLSNRHLVENCKPISIKFDEKWSHNDEKNLASFTDFLNTGIQTVGVNYKSPVGVSFKIGVLFSAQHEVQAHMANFWKQAGPALTGLKIQTDSCNWTADQIEFLEFPWKENPIENIRFPHLSYLSLRMDKVLNFASALSKLSLRLKSLSIGNNNSGRPSSTKHCREMNKLLKTQSGCLRKLKIKNIFTLKDRLLDGVFLSELTRFSTDRWGREDFSLKQQFPKLKQFSFILTNSSCIKQFRQRFEHEPNMSVVHIEVSICDSQFISQFLRENLPKSFPKIKRLTLHDKPIDWIEIISRLDNLEELTIAGSVNLDTYLTGFTEEKVKQIHNMDKPSFERECLLHHQKLEIEPWSALNKIKVMRIKVKGEFYLSKVAVSMVLLQMENLRELQVQGYTHGWFQINIKDNVLPVLEQKISLKIQQSLIEKSKK